MEERYEWLPLEFHFFHCDFVTIYGTEAAKRICMVSVRDCEVGFTIWNTDGHVLLA